MPTLLQINTVINSGSTGRIAEEIGSIALSKGWRSVIAYGLNPRPSQSETIRIGSDWDIWWHGVETRLFDRHGLASKSATKRLIYQIKELRPDIIHLHNIHGYYLNYRLLFDYFSTINTPIVWTLHDCWAMTGHCSYFTFSGCDRWKKGCFSCPQTKEYPASYMIDRSQKNWTDKRDSFTKIESLTIVPVSNWLSQIVNDSFIGKYPIQRIYNGVDLKTFKPQESKITNGKIRLLGVASVWNARKGLADFISLREKLSLEQFEIVLAGLTPQQIQSLPNGIVGISRTENVQELCDLYTSAHVVLNLSVQETFGLTTIEGFACGIPGVVYNCTASPELITPETGTVVEQGDIDGLVSAIKNLLERDQAMISEACRERAVTHFNKNDRWMEYIDLYQELLKSK